MTQRLTRALPLVRAVVVLLVCLLTGFPSLSAQSIPVTQAGSLAGATVHLPADLRGRPGLLVLGFSRSSSQQTKPWADAIDRDFGSDRKLAFYQLPMLQQLPRVMRGFVLQGIRKPLSSADRARFVPVFDKEADWKVAARFSAPDDAYVLLVNGLGQVQARSQGVFREDKYRALQRQATALGRLLIHCGEYGQ